MVRGAFLSALRTRPSCISKGRITFSLNRAASRAVDTDKARLRKSGPEDPTAGVSQTDEARIILDLAAQQIDAQHQVFLWLEI